MTQQTIDVINATFEFFAGYFAFINLLILIRDKETKGISLLSSTFFALWAFWNSYYLYSLNQPFSFYASIGITISNLSWIILAVHYYYKTKTL